MEMVVEHMKKQRFFLFQWMDSIPTPVVNFITIVSFLFALPGYILSFISFFFPTIKTDLIDHIKLVLLYNQYVFSLLQLLLFFFIGYRCISYYSDAKNRLQLFPFAFHKLTHSYRDLETEIETNIQNYTLTKKDLVITIRDHCIASLDSLCQVLEEITGKPVYGCIKLVDMKGSDETPRSIKDQTVSGFARSSNTPECRREKYPPKHDFIRDNTDFLELMDYNNIRNQFYQPDLQRYMARLQEDDHEYKNSSPNWSSHYLSTVVVPIQIRNTLLPTPENEAFHVLGFLCVDSPHANTFSLKHKDPIVHFLKAYADLLYRVFIIYHGALREITTPAYIEKYCNVIRNANNHTAARDPNDVSSIEHNES